MTAGKVLIVEDNPVNLRLAQFLLEKKGFLVRKAGSSAECLAEMTRELGVQIRGVDAIARDVRRGLANDRLDAGGRARQITEDIRATGDAFVGIEIDEDERRDVHPPRAGAKGALHRHVHRGRADRADRQRGLVRLKADTTVNHHR